MEKNWFWRHRRPDPVCAPQWARSEQPDTKPVNMTDLMTGVKKRARRSSEKGGVSKPVAHVESARRVSTKWKQFQGSKRSVDNLSKD